MLLLATAGVVPIAGAVTPPVWASVPQRSVHHADVDGDGRTDTVVIKPLPDLHVRGGFGTGHYRLRVELATGAVLTKRMRVDFYYGGAGQTWTPWLGKTQLDQVVGQELVLGRTSGAHTQVYAVVTYRSGRLHVLDSPDATADWVINSSYGTGSQGWKCTAHGVRSRSVTPNGAHTRYVIDVADYVLRLAWHETRHVHYSVRADAHGNPPAYTESYPDFACPGLPPAL